MKLVKMSIMLLVAITIVAGSALAAPVRIGAITSGIEMPARVALDSQGNLYVTDPAKGRVKKYDSNGQYLTSFEAPYPLGVAVDANGNVYVGTRNDSSRSISNTVKIYSANLQPTGCLGTAGNCERFGTPNDIAIDNAGRIYVVDSEYTVSAVKVFEPNGALAVTITGSSANKLRKPMGIAINDATGEVFITDSPVVASQGYSVDGARISVFSKNGGFIRSFGQYGDDIGMMKSIVSIAIDNAGSLYVTDSGQSVVHHLNAADGTFLGGDLFANYSYQPSGVAISKGSIVNVAIQKTDGPTGRIDLYGLDGYVTLSAAPAVLSFDAKQFGGNPPAQTVVIANTGSGTLTWSASADQAWIKLGQQNAVGPNSSVGFDISADVAALTAGAYTGKVTLTTAAGQKAVIAVTLNVSSASLWNISSQSLSFSVKKGNNSASGSVTIGVDNATGPWTAVSDVPWLTITPASGGPAPAAATVTAAVNGLAAGPYTGHIALSAPGAVIDARITVSLAVYTGGGRIRVTTNRSNAAFTVSGPTTTTGTGTAWSATDVLPGTYTVAFDAAAGYKRPVSLTKTLTDGGDVAFNGAYISWKDLAAKKNIIVAQEALTGTETLVKAFKGNGTPTALDLRVPNAGAGASIAVGDIDGDGMAEMVVGTGDGSALVKVYKADRSKMLELGPVGTANKALHVAVADLNGDGRAEVLVENSGAVTVHTYDVASGTMIPTGIEIATGCSSGAALATADTEGDGLPVVITASRPGMPNSGPIKVWKIDTTSSVGSWAASLQKDISAGGDLGASVAGADVDGDGKDEIIIGSGGERSTITIMRPDGFPVQFRAFDNHGVNVAAADLDGDGNAEIVTAPVMGSAVQRTKTAEKPALSKMEKRHQDQGQQAAQHQDDDDDDHENGTIRVYSATGTLKLVIRPFDGAAGGINLAIGDLGF